MGNKQQGKNRCVSSHERDEPFTHVFLFINPTSGGNAGAALTALEMSMVQFKEPQPVSLHFVNLKDPDDRARGVAELREVDNAKETRPCAVAAGGDGTVKWLVGILNEAKLVHTPIGVVPFGTGNDMARVLGWGGSAPKPLVGEGCKDLREHARSFAKARPVPFDVWEVTLELLDDTSSGFYQVEACADGKKKEVRQEKLGRSMTTEMINYFSIGADAHIAVDFEKNRRKSQIGNKMVYGAVGIKHTLTGHSSTIAKMVSGMHVDLTPEDSPKKKSPTSPKKQIGETGGGAAGDAGADDSSLLLHLPHGKAHVLVWQNIPSYGGGNNIWGAGEKQQAKVVTKKNKHRKRPRFAHQGVNDGLLELMTVDHARHIAEFMATHGVSEKLTEGIHHEMQASRYEVRMQDGLGDVFCQIDGEGFLLKGLKTVSIRRKGQVVMLANEGDKERKKAASMLVKTKDWTVLPDPKLLLDYEPTISEKVEGHIGDLVAKTTKKSKEQEEKVPSDPEAAGPEGVTAIMKETEKKMGALSP